MTAQKERLPVKNRTPDDIALQRKYDKRKVDTPARLRSDNEDNNQCTVMPDVTDPSDIAFHGLKMFRAFGTTSADLQQHFLTQVVSMFKGYSSTGNPDGEKLVRFCNMGVAILDEIRPRDIDAPGAELKQEAFDPITLIRVDASRYNSGGECLIYFHGEYSRFDEGVRR
jgi:hypothetical protein